MFIFVLIISIFLAVFFRVILLLRHKWVGVDTFFHLLRVKYLRKGVKNWHKRSFFRPEKIAPYYPPLFDFFLFIFPFKDYSNFRFLPVFFDLANVCLILWFFSNFLSPEQISIAFLVYSISPLLIYQSYSLSPRLFSNFLFTLASLGLFSYFLTSNTLYLIVSVIFSSLIFLSHKLSLQSLVFFFMCLSIVMKDLIPLIVLGLAFFLALLISKGFYFKVLRAHLWLIYFYIKRGLSPRLKKEFFWIFGSFPFLILILFRLNYLIQYQFLLTWFVSLVVLSFLWVIGDGYRHMTNAIFPGSILVALLYPFSGLDLGVFILSFLLCIFVNIYLIRKVIPSRIISKDLLKCYEFVKINGKQNDIVYTFPPYFAYATPFFVNMRGYYGSELQLKRDVHKIRWVITNNPNLGLVSKFKKVFRSGNFYVFHSS